MATRSIFNRTYTDFQSGSTEVFLVNGQGNVTGSSPIVEIEAGVDMIAGTPVYPSGNVVVPGIASVGVDPQQLSIVGFVSADVTAGDDAAVITDGVIDLSAINITAESALSAGQYYYLSKYRGEVVKYETASGTITGSGVDAYAASAPLGLAINTTQLSIELNSPILLYAGV